MLIEGMSHSKPNKLYGKGLSKVHNPAVRSCVNILVAYTKKGKSSPDPPKLKGVGQRDTV